MEAAQRLSKIVSSQVCNVCQAVMTCANIPSPCASCFDAERASRLLPACLKENQGARFACGNEAFPCGPLLECGDNAVDVGPCSSPSVADGVLAADGEPCSHASLVATLLYKYKHSVCIWVAVEQTMQNSAACLLQDECGVASVIAFIDNFV